MKNNVSSEKRRYLYWDLMYQYDVYKTCSFDLVSLSD